MKETTIQYATRTEYAIRTLCEELRNDPQYFMSWQANIAMAFKDQSHWDKRDWNSEELHETANNAAIHFLRVLTGTLLTHPDSSRK